MSSPPRKEPYLPDWLVQNRNFVLLWAAYGVAAFGDHLSEMALLKERNAFQSDYLTRIQALITFGFFLPFVVIGPFAGWWSDRFSRRTTMIAADLIRAVIVFNMAFICGANSPPGSPASYGDYSHRHPTRDCRHPGRVLFARAAGHAADPHTRRPARAGQRHDLRAWNDRRRPCRSRRRLHRAAMGAGVELSHQYGHVLQQRCACGLHCDVRAPVRSRTHRWKASGHRSAPVFHYVHTHARVLQLILLGTAYWAAAGVVISVVPAIAKLYYGENYAMAGTFRGLLVIGIASGATVLTILGAAIPISIAPLGWAGRSRLLVHRPGRHHVFQARSRAYRRVPVRHGWRGCGRARDHHGRTPAFRARQPARPSFRCDRHVHDGRAGRRDRRARPAEHPALGRLRLLGCWRRPGQGCWRQWRRRGGTTAAATRSRHPSG